MLILVHSMRRSSARLVTKKLMVFPENLSLGRTRSCVCQFVRHLVGKSPFGCSVWLIAKRSDI